MKKRLFKRSISMLLAVVMMFVMMPDIPLFEASAESVCEHEYPDTPCEHKEPTCVKYGYTLYGCMKCGNVVLGETIAPLGHSWLETGETAEASCTNDGGILYSCELCGETKGSIPATGHLWVATGNTRAPTCTTPGAFEYKCKYGCGEIMLMTDENQPALDHDLLDVAATAPTCTTSGNTAGATCQRSGCTYTTVISLPAAGHNYVNGECTKCYYSNKPTDTTEGTCGENLAWILDLDTGVLSISGTGAMHDYGHLGMPWDNYKDVIKTIKINNGVTSICKSAFSDCSSLTTISISNSVTSIGNGAFYSCSNLTSITIPDSVTSIGDGAFQFCSSLTSINIPDGVTSIGKYTFCYTHLKSITIPNNVKSIGKSAFSLCDGLASITIPDGVISIGDSAFQSCSSLTSITIPESVTSIGDSAFQFCSSLTSITIPERVTSIGDGAFSGCNSLTSITVAEGNIKYKAAGNCLIETATNTLIAGCKNSVIPSGGSVTRIGDYAFSYCRGLASVTIPASVESIGKVAFRGCSSLTSITIPDGVISIGDSAFADCNGLTSVIIPASVESIGNGAFCYCGGLKTIIYCGTEDEWNAVTKGTDWNYATSAVVKFHNYVDCVCTECGDAIHNYVDGVCTGCGDEIIDENAPQLVVDSTSALIGNTFKVSVNLKNNPGVWAVAFELPIDTNVFEFVSADTGNSIFKQFGTCGFDDSEGVNAYKFNGSNNSFLSNMTSDGTVVVLTLKVKDGVSEGEYKLALTLLKRSIIDCDGAKVSFASVDGTVDVREGLLGDVDGDGLITNADVLMIYKYIYNAKLYPLDEAAGDVDGDGSVTNADVLMIYKYIYNPVLYPIG